MASQPKDPNNKRRNPARKNASKKLRQANPGMRHQQALNVLAHGAPEPSPAPPKNSRRLADALGLHTVQDITAHWAQMGISTEMLTVPFGVDATGQLVHLNLSETAVASPHGILLGRTALDRHQAVNAIVTALRALNPPSHLQVVAAGPHPGFQRIADTAFTGHDWDLEFGAWLTNELLDRSKVIHDTGIDDFRNFPVGTLPRMLVIAHLTTETARERIAQPRSADHLELIGRLSRQGRALGINLLVSGSKIPHRSDQQPYAFAHNLTYGISIQRTGHGVAVPAPLPLPHSVNDDTEGTPVELLSAESLNHQVNLARAMHLRYTQTAARDAVQAAGFQLPPPATRPIGQKPT